MAVERQRRAGELAAWHMAEIVRRVTGEVVNVSEVNPYRPAMSAAAKVAKAASEKRKFWGNLQIGMFGETVFKD
jgi:hypothetical protein